MTSIKTKEAMASGDHEEVYRSVDTLHQQLQTLETFIARRFDEISMEINATSQQFDMAEDGIVKRFTEVLELLSAINYHGDGSTAANTGVELEAVIIETEKAANTILDSADNIAAKINDKDAWDNAETRENIRQGISNDIQNILMACTFQDITGQRIRNTLSSLHNIEDRLNQTFERLGVEIKPNADALSEKVKSGQTQDDIDALFSGNGASGTDDASSQGDIDKLFD